MHVFKRSKVNLLADRIEVNGLAADHTKRATGMRQALNHGNPIFCRYLEAGVVSEDMESLRLEAITGKNRRGLIKGDMTGWLAAPERIVIHGRQVIVNERVHVNHLNGTGRPIQKVKVESKCTTSGIGQERTQAFATAQGGIAHGLMQAFRDGGNWRESLVQSLFSPVLADRHKFFQSVGRGHQYAGK